MLMEPIQHLNDSMTSRLLKLDETLTNLVQAVNNWNQNVAVFNANVETDFRSFRWIWDESVSSFSSCYCWGIAERKIINSMLVLCMIFNI